MIPRHLGPVLGELARRYPVLTVTGPRQSGKTTLCRAMFADHGYASLERLTDRRRCTPGCGTIPPHVASAGAVSWQTPSGNRW